MRDKVREIYNIEKAYEYIDINPTILNLNKKNILDYFDKEQCNELIKWPIYAIKTLTSLENVNQANICTFLESLNECQITYKYMGYILQLKYNINVLKIIIEAIENNYAWYKYLIVCLKNENSVDMEDIIKIFSLMNTKHIDDNYEIYSNLSFPVVEFGLDRDILNMLFVNPSKEIYKLLSHVGRIIVKENKNKLFDIIEELNSENYYYSNLLLIDYFQKAIYVTGFKIKKYIKKINELSRNKEYYLKLIPLLVILISDFENIEIPIELKKKFKEMVLSSIETKQSFMNLTNFYNQNEEITSIIDEITQSNFKKDEIILKDLDNYLAKLVDSCFETAIFKLLTIYINNGYTIQDVFFNNLYETVHALMNNKNTVDYFMLKIINGSAKEFLFCIELFNHVINMNYYEQYLSEQKLNSNDFVRIFKGLLYFSLEGKKICKFVLITAKKITLNEEAFNWIVTELYDNYPKTFYEESKVIDENESNKMLLHEIQVKYDYYKEAIERASNNLKPSYERIRIYNKYYNIRNKLMEKNMEKESLLIDLFPCKMMKYGSKFGAIKEYDNEKNIESNDYARISYKIELPNILLDNEVRFHDLRQSYLRERGK